MEVVERVMSLQLVSGGLLIISLPHIFRQKRLYRHERRLFIFKRTYLLYILPLEWPEVVPLVDVEVVHLLVGLDFLSVPDKVVVCVQAEQ